ncbi:MAG: hypothetical protein AAF358_13580 [Pseudomonadota bacterium]
MKVFEAEIEVTRLYCVKFRAESLERAADEARKIALTAASVEEIGESTDFETNLVGVSRQVGRKMYQ